MRSSTSTRCVITSCNSARKSHPLATTTDGIVTSVRQHLESVRCSHADRAGANAYQTHSSMAVPSELLCSALLGRDHRRRHRFRVAPMARLAARDNPYVASCVLCQRRHDSAALRPRHPCQHGGSGRRDRRPLRTTHACSLGGGIGPVLAQHLQAPRGCGQHVALLAARGGSRRSDHDANHSAPIHAGDEGAILRRSRSPLATGRRWSRDLTSLMSASGQTTGVAAAQAAA